VQSNRLNLEHFPDSSYAHELRGGGLGRLRFDALLEAEYTVAQVVRARSRVRIWFTVSAVLALLFTVEQVRRTGVWNLLSLAHLGALLPFAVALVWLVWGRQYRRHYFPAAWVLVTINSALISVFIAHALSIGRDEQLAALTVNLVAIFFFAGLMYRQALLTCAAMLIAFAVTAVAVNLAFAMLLKSVVIMIVTSGIAAIVYRDVEQSQRRNFLEHALISELVARDSLSGLMNRRAFDEHLLRVWQHALRDQRVVAVLMVDIDHFKAYNDAFGHQAGDLALCNVAKVLQGFARRPLDLAARYGGEEFAVILYDLALPHIQDVAERLREAVQNLRMKSRETALDSGPEVTVSVGVGVGVPTMGRTPQGIVQLADEALYAAKQAGRNCVVVYGAEAYGLLDTGAFQTPLKSRRQQ
jgi:diguanylate cyclase (GGDEF)-like protein